MPLIQGYSREAISSNISREMHRGTGQDQAVAIALSTARRAFRELHPRRRLPAYLRGRRNPDVRCPYCEYEASGPNARTELREHVAHWHGRPARLATMLARARSVRLRRRRRNPDRGEWIDLVVPVVALWLLVRSRVVRLGG